MEVDSGKIDSKKADSKERDFAKGANSAKQDSDKIDSSKPKSAQDEHEAMVRRIRHFVSLLEFEKPIVYVDEGYSSHIASERLAHLAREDKARAHKDGRIDSLAACEILSRYIAHHAKSTR
nr:Holliday junction resolvase RuvX [Helicobacter sp. CLO-3]